MLLPLNIGSTVIRQAPGTPAQNPRCYGGLAAFWSITEMAEMAEREGFEPPVELPPRRISSAVHSTTLPPLREMRGRNGPVDTGGLMA